MKNYIVEKKKRLETFLRENRNYAMPAILLVGFFLDTLTLRQIDRVFDNVVLLTHTFIIATTIALLFSVDTRFGRRFGLENKKSTISALMLFSFGGLFSGFVVFYSRSGSLISSWPFILLMLLLMIATEMRKKYYEKLILQITIFYIGIFSYLIFSLPVVVKKMGPTIYLLSGIVSLLFIYGYLALLQRIDRQKMKIHTKKLFVRIVSIFVVFNLLYFTNIIPPIPLSLNFISVYHDFSRIQAVEYRGQYEVPPVWQFWRKRSRVFHREAGETIYVFSEVYAPINLNTDIYHKWEYFDSKKTRWIETDEVRIPITGGRADGFRGFSKKTNVFPGSWRVKITTGRGQMIGRITFSIKDADEPIITKEEVFR